MITRRRRDNLLAAAFASIVVAFGTDARAQGMALSRFEPSERGSRFFVADSLELGDGRPGQKARLAVGMPASYAFRTRVFGDEREGENSRLVEHSFYLHPGASVTISPGARFALDVPIAFQSGTDANLANHFYPAPASPRFGDVRPAFDLRLFEIGPATFAVGVMGYLPLGSQEALTGDDYVRFGARFAATVRADPFVIASRVGYMYRREGFVGGTSVGSEIHGVVAAAFARGIWFLGPEVWTSTFIDDAFGKRSTPVDLLLGGHATFGDLRAGLAIGRSIAPGLGSTYLRIAFSIEWVKASTTSVATNDRDHDGVPDALDACPDVFGDAPSGCPPAPTEPPPSPPPPTPMVPEQDDPADHGLDQSHRGCWEKTAYLIRESQRHVATRATTRSVSRSPSHLRNAKRCTFPLTTSPYLGVCGSIMCDQHPSLTTSPNP